MSKKSKKKIKRFKDFLAGTIGGAFITANLPEGLNIKRDLIRDWNTLALPYLKSYASAVILFAIGSWLIFLYQLFVKHIWPTLLILLALLQARIMANSSSQRTREQALVLVMMVACMVICMAVLKRMEEEKKLNTPTA